MAMVQDTHRTVVVVAAEAVAAVEFPLPAILRQ